MGCQCACEKPGAPLLTHVHGVRAKGRAFQIPAHLFPIRFEIEQELTRCRRRRRIDWLDQKWLTFDKHGAIATPAFRVPNFQGGRIGTDR